VQLVRGQELVRANEAITNNYFLEGGLSSVVVEQRREKPIAVGMFGLDGVSGPSVLLGKPTCPYRTLVLIGGEAFRIETAVLMQAMDASASFRRVLLGYVDELTLQMAETIASPGLRVMEQQVARWLSMAQARVGSELQVTHELIANMLGVRRAGVTIALHVLEGKHVLRSERGRVIIRRPDLLRSLADTDPERTVAPAINDPLNGKAQPAALLGVP